MEKHTLHGVFGHLPHGVVKYFNTTTGYSSFVCGMNQKQKSYCTFLPQHKQPSHTHPCSRQHMSNGHVLTKGPHAKLNSLILCLRKSSGVCWEWRFFSQGLFTCAFPPHTQDPESHQSNCLQEWMTVCRWTGNAFWMFNRVKWKRIIPLRVRDCTFFMWAVLNLRHTDTVQCFCWMAPKVRSRWT